MSVNDPKRPQAQNLRLRTSFCAVSSGEIAYSAKSQVGSVRKKRLGLKPMGGRGRKGIAANDSGDVKIWRVVMKLELLTKNGFFNRHK